MFHEEPLGPPPPAPAPPPPLQEGGRPWRLRDLAAGTLLAVIGFGVILAATIAAAVWGSGRQDPLTAMIVVGGTLVLEVWLGAIVLLLARIRRVSLRTLGLRAAGARALDHQGSYVLLALFGAYACVLGYAGAVTLLQQATGVDLSGIMEGNQLPDDLPRTVGVWLVIGLATVVAAPLGEELFFRGFVYRGLADRFGAVAGIVGSGIAFSLVHFNVSVIVPFAAIGMVFAWVYRASGSLWTTIAAHAIFNGVSFVATLYGVGS
ncbi:MAG: lysostaphin resistance A-like protein [Dehalococcoidia bacterium]